jgi:hypothetical protein
MGGLQAVNPLGVHCTYILLIYKLLTLSGMFDISLDSENRPT